MVQPLLTGGANIHAHLMVVWLVGWNAHILHDSLGPPHVVSQMAARLV